MAKQTIEGQQKAIDEENKIISNIETHYRGRNMPEHEKMYVGDLQKKILERETWIKGQLNDIAKIGKTVFLTREAAEKALEELSNDTAEESSVVGKGVSERR